MTELHADGSPCRLAVGRRMRLDDMGTPRFARQLESKSKTSHRSFSISRAHADSVVFTPTSYTVMRISRSSQMEDLHAGPSLRVAKGATRRGVRARSRSSISGSRTRVPLTAQCNLQPRAPRDLCKTNSILATPG